MPVPPRLQPAILLALVLAAAGAPVASAAPPPNDAPAAAAAFEPYAAKNGAPSERQATAELREATPDPGVPRCLGPGSFARTVWYRLPATPDGREIKVEAVGRTVRDLDLAAFVQEGAPSPPRTARANACAGQGVGGDDATEDRTPALRLRVPPGHTVLVQVGARGGAGAPEDETAVLSLSELATLPILAPTGDRAGLGTPTIGRSGRTSVVLGGATTSEEDPAVPRCPSLGTVWRRVKPRRGGRLTISADRTEAATLSVFTGSRPTRRSFVDCVNREGRGPLALTLKARARRTLWVRIGTDRPPENARATVDVRRSRGGDATSGGGCLASPDPRVSGRPTAGSRRVRVRMRQSRLGLVLRAARGPVCAARIEVVGPRGRVYARGFVPILRGVPVAVALPRVRKLRRGLYRLRIDAAGLGGTRRAVRSTVRFRLTR